MKGIKKYVKIERKDKLFCKKNVCRPGKLYVKPGQEVFFTYVNTDARIFIPEANKLFENHPANLLFELEKDNKHPSLVVKEQIDSQIKRKPYEYAVFCEQGNSFAVGNSTPKIIIE